MNPDVLASALDAIDEALVICDRLGAVVHMNRAARELFADEPPAARADLLEHPAFSHARREEVGGGSEVLVGAREVVVPLAESERRVIEQALAETGWQLASAARRLGISRTTLWRRLKSYGLHRPDGAGSGGN